MVSLQNRIKNIAHLFVNHTTALCYGYPIRKLKVIAVTGTDGKTTTTHLISHILRAAGYKVASISTTGAIIDGEESVDMGFHVTTPTGTKLQRFLRKAVYSNCDYLVVEVTAHGLAQHRLAGLHPEISIFTNITNNEHLDYFGDFNIYFEAKAQLIRLSQSCLFNQEDVSASQLIAIAKQQKVSFATFDSNHVRSLVGTTWQAHFPGEYNLQNAAAAIKCATVLGVNEQEALSFLQSASPPPGRFEKLEIHGVSIVIDFAHTPQALNHLLSENRIDNGKNIVVFGCAGLRDHTKRKLMGEIAMQLADQIVITAEDPRTEDVNTINAEIARGAAKYGKKNEDFFIIPDRAAAIEFALTALSTSGDRVFITGKGHETSMCFGTTEYPWSDRETVINISESLK